MRFRDSLWFGFLMGFLFGTVGMWIFAMLSLALVPAEFILQPFFWPGRWVGTFIVQDGSMGNGGVLLLFLINGLFYAAIGAIIQMVVRKLKGGRRA